MRIRLLFVDRMETIALQVRFHALFTLLSMLKHDEQ